MKWLLYCRRQLLCGLDLHERSDWRATCMAPDTQSSFSDATLSAFTANPYIHHCLVCSYAWQQNLCTLWRQTAHQMTVLLPIMHSFNRTKSAIVRLHWVEHLNKTYNSNIMYATSTKLAKSTALDDLAIILEARSCKPLVTKLASTLHTCQAGDLCLIVSSSVIKKRLMYQRLKGFHFSETGSIPAPHMYSFEPSDTESDSSLENSNGDSDHSRLLHLSW